MRKKDLIRKILISSISIMIISGLVGFLMFILWNAEYDKLDEKTDEKPSSPSLNTYYFSCCSSNSCCLLFLILSIIITVFYFTQYPANKQRNENKSEIGMKIYEDNKAKVENEIFNRENNIRVMKQQYRNNSL